MDILVTRHLTLRGLLEVDADDIRELTTNEPALLAKLPHAMIALINRDDQTNVLMAQQILVVIREKLIGWISFNEAEATGFTCGNDGFAAEAMAAALSYFVRPRTGSSGNSTHQQQSNQFAA